MCEALSEEHRARLHITSTPECMSVLHGRGTIFTNAARRHREQRQCWPGRQAHRQHCEMGVWLLPLYVLPPVPNTFLRLAHRVSLRSSAERDHGPQRTQLSGQACAHLLFRRQLVAQNEGLHVANRKTKQYEAIFTLGRRQAHTH
jgi:hypothetical protein